MSFVGPRPALFNQDDLITLRREKGIDKLLPGITGWAQVNGRDILSVTDKIDLDVEYMQRQSFWFDMKILWMTFLKVIKRDGVSH
jgi:O-antigen biosynthesis protein WbqP